MNDVIFQCSHCGATMSSPKGVCPNCGVYLTPSNATRSYFSRIEDAERRAKEENRKLVNKWTFTGKKKTTALILWFFSSYGLFPLYAYYLGFYKSAIFKTIFGMPGVAAMVLLINSIADNTGSGIVHLPIGVLGAVLFVILLWYIIDLVKLLAVAVFIEGE